MTPRIRSPRFGIQKVAGGWEIRRNSVTSFYATIDEMPLRERLIVKATPYVVLFFILGWVVMIPVMLLLYLVLEPLSKLLGFKNPITLQLSDEKETSRG